MVIWETERLLLRHYSPTDWDDLAALYADPEFTRFLNPPSSREQVRDDIAAYIEEYERIGYGFYATLYKPDGRFIGRCGLLSQCIEGVKEVEVAYGIAPAYWGRGVGTEAARAVKEYGFRQFGFPRLISLVDHDNIASQRVAEKNGMQRQKSIEIDGRPFYLYVVEKPE